MTASVTPLRRPRMHDELSRQLGAMIVNGDVAPGETLPNEMSLCEQYGVSRSVVRECLRVLASKGLLVARARVGTIVQTPDHWQLMDNDILSWMESGPALEKLLKSLIETRLLIEPEAAAMAARRARATDLVAIESALDDMALTEADRDAHFDADFAFHAAIIAASGNVIFGQFLGVIRKALIESFKRSSRRTAQRQVALPRHTAVFDAIRAKDETAARLAMTELLDEARKVLFAEPET
ncbi:MAG: FadR/GntR family transcriptional regulator [Erythrobacter sp.]|uniref:FadR/GntR family transcriptional regulator n=1 Tax=Erythrobacter sp. TaxID=1042 RepID=UPI0026232850|nr:FadR/GntR family transcriptional regulator [Erythrobacter sp.]MDJ0977301.1 FadR/GntR family transcriptional regulator [Erythrobacter sp.]